MSSFIYLPTFIDNSFRFLTNLLLKSYKCFCSTNYVKDQFELNVDSFLFFVFLFLFSFHKEVLWDSRVVQTETSSLRGSSSRRSRGPSGPTGTSASPLYLAYSQEVSEIWTRFHVTETLPAAFPPFLSPAFCLPSQVLSGPVKALWIVSNLIVLILLPVHGQKKNGPPCGFSFCDVLSSPPGNTPHSSRNRSLCDCGRLLYR